MGERHGAGRGEFCGDGGVNGAFGGRALPSPPRWRLSMRPQGWDARCPSEYHVGKAAQVWYTIDP